MRCIVPTLTLAAVIVTGCSPQAPSLDTEDMAWRAGCSALSAGVALQGVKRDAQQEVLSQIVDSSHLPAVQRGWAKKGISLLAYDDVRKAPKSLRRAVGSPCQQHGHPIGALD